MGADQAGSFHRRVAEDRTKTTNRTDFRLNRAQREYSRQCTKQNVVLKARQVGITTYIAARFFVQTITRRGTLSMQVTQDRESAEDIFRIVRRFWEKLPDDWRRGFCELRTVTHGSWCFQTWTASTVWLRRQRMPDEAGRSRICIARRFRAGAEKATRRWRRCGRQSCREATLCWSPRRTERVDFSTRSGSGQTIRDIPVTFSPGGLIQPTPLTPARIFRHFTEEEAELAAVHGLKIEQIAWRRKQWASLRGLAAQEYAEDPVSCFRASGECVFDLAAVEQALREVRANRWRRATTGGSRSGCRRKRSGST